MIHIPKTSFKDVYLAYSGGMDSTVLLHLLLAKHYRVTLLYIHHGDPLSDLEAEHLYKVAKQHNLPTSMVMMPVYNSSIQASKEQYWSEQRDDAYQKLDMMVVTGHHLDDAVEWYVMSTMSTGTSKLMNQRRGNVFRPLLLTSKAEIKEYAAKYALDYITDPTNNLPECGLRNKVRALLMPSLLECFPGIRTTVRKLLLMRC